MDRPEPFALTSAASPRRLADLALPATVTGLVGAGIGAVMLGVVRDYEALAVSLLVLATVGGAAIATGARLLGRSFGAAEAQGLPRHRGVFRYEAGRSGAVGVIAIVGFLASALVRGGEILGPPAQLCLALGVLAAPVIFVIQRKRSARALPPSIR